MPIRGVIYLCSQLLSLWAMAQSSLKILIQDAHETPIPGAYIELLTEKKQEISDHNGIATFYGLRENERYKITVKALGFTTETFEVTCSPTHTQPLLITLKEDIKELGEVIVTSTAADLAGNDSFKPEVVSLGSIRATPQPVTHILGQISGVRIRQEGGMGSQSNIMLNGIDGKGVRVFLDDLPVYLLGDAFDINNISPNMINRIEVFKGLIPVKFGSDALGGVINLVTRNDYSDFLDVSYTVGSWNTHQAGINAKKNFGKSDRYYISLDGFYNHSDNNYWMNDREVPIDDLGNTAAKDVRRFHDQYSAVLGRVQLGVKDLTWANDLRLILSATHIDKQWQHGFSSDLPWGKAASTHSSLNAAVSWKKLSSIQEKWDISMTGGYNLREVVFVDTVARTYYWDGSFIGKTLQGESGVFEAGRNPELVTQNLFYRANLNYALSKQHKVNINVLSTYERLTGEDEAGAATYTEDPFKIPQKLFKGYAGLALESKLLNGAITNVASLKFFYNHSYAVSLKIDKSVAGYLSNDNVNLGFGEVMKWHFANQFDYMVGYEYTVRQPDSQEIFGDYITIGPNADLAPERSHNVNTGVSHHSADHKLNASITTFYRLTEDRIFLSAVSTNLSTYVNLLSSKALGFEGNIKFNPIPNLKLLANATWQNLTLTEGDDNGVIKERYVGARVPNTPYLFGNLVGAYSWQNPASLKGSITSSYSVNYIHEFFRTWAVDGKASSKETIPTQLLQNINISYLTPSKRWSIGLECRNLFDVEAYDNYSIQKPGRSFYAKLRMSLNKNN